MMEEDMEYDEVMGAHGAKSKMRVLNKKNLSPDEMDELLGGELYG